MSEEKKVLDIGDRQKTFDQIALKMSALDKAFRAITMDYSFHIETTFGKEHKIFKIREDVDFRLFTSKFHLELLLRQHFYVEQRIEEILKREPEKIFREVYPSNPIFDHCEKEVTAIFDSIIFHLASIYDYMSSIVNFIVNNKDESISKWSQLNNATRQKDIYKHKKVSSAIIKHHNDFVNKLYIHRSRLIHEKSDIHPISLKISTRSGKSDIKFFARNELLKNFSELKKKSKESKITISYVANWLIENTIHSIVDILLSLSVDIENKSTFPNHIAPTDFVMIYRNPDTGVGEPVSKRMWEEVKKEMNIT